MAFNNNQLFFTLMTIDASVLLLRRLKCFIALFLVKVHSHALAHRNVG